MARATGQGGQDYPDFYQSITPHQNPVEINLAELAVRLGTPQVFERTGNVIIIDQFKYGTGDWELVSRNAGCIPYLVGSSYFLDPYAIKLQTGGLAGDFSGIRKRFPFPYPKTLGFEYAMRFETDFDIMDLTATIVTFTKSYTVGFRIDKDNNRLYYYNELPVWEYFADYNFLMGANAGWHIVKMVVNFETENYVRCSYDDVDFDMVSIPMYIAAGGISPYIMPYFRLYEIAARVDFVYIDNFILTINEPE